MPFNRFKKNRPLFSSPPPREIKKPKCCWRVLPFLGSVVRKICTAIGAFVLVCFIGIVFFSAQLSETAAPPLPEKMVLYLEFMDGFDEEPAGPSLAGAFEDSWPTVHDMVAAIDAAVLDPRVEGIMARMQDGNFQTAQSVEIREALMRFRVAGKFTKIYSSSYGDASGGLGRFYLASAFEERWMQPLGVVSISGISAEMPFMRNVLDKIGVKPEFYKRKDYKNAFETFTDAQMSEPNREAITALITDIRDAIVKDIVADMQITPGQFGQLVNKGLFTAKEALAEKLITRSDYVDVMVSEITEKITGDPESDEEIFVDPLVYLGGVATQKNGHPKVALVYAVGAIMDNRLGASSMPGFAEEGIAAADEIASALLEAADDPEIGAVVVRVDSPGGSPVASETILRAIEKVKEKGKPVIVSMGATAASGGYWIAASADRIFAEPTTLTGSIGVVGGKFSAQELWTKVGVNWDGVQWGQNAGLWSMNKPFSETESERMNVMLDQVYEAFIERVAKGRNLTLARVDEIARGRVWSGAKAKELGLVDELGGLKNALDFTAKKLGAENAADLDVVILPEPKSAFEEIMDLLAEQGAVFESLRLQSALGKIFSPAMNQWAVIQSSGPVSAYQPVRVH